MLLSRVVSDEQVALVPEYHWEEYGLVPPDGLAVRVIDWPESSVGLVGPIPPDIKAPLTVTVSPDEHCETWVLAASVTLYEYVVVDVGEGA